MVKFIQIFRKIIYLEWFMYLDCLNRFYPALQTTFIAYPSRAAKTRHVHTHPYCNRFWNILMITNGLFTILLYIFRSYFSDGPLLNRLAAPTPRHCARPDEFRNIAGDGGTLSIHIHMHIHAHTQYDIPILTAYTTFSIRIP